MTSLAPAADVAPADWIAGQLGPLAGSVLSLVPGGFDAYVRVFHPAGLGSIPVRWSEIARANGTIHHGGIQLSGLTRAGPWPPAQPGVFDSEPRRGRLPPLETTLLATALGRHTTAPERCWFAVWEGWGGLRDEFRAAPAFETPGRRYHLFSGPADAAAESAGSLLSKDPASIWWPDDRAWCVATGIDLDSTYVGCDRACARDLLAIPEIEALEVAPATGIAYDSDALNPASEPPDTR